MEFPEQDERTYRDTFKMRVLMRFLSKLSRKDINWIWPRATWGVIEDKYKALYPDDYQAAYEEQLVDDVQRRMRVNGDTK